MFKNRKLVVTLEKDAAQSAEIQNKTSIDWAANAEQIAKKLLIGITGATIAVIFAAGAKEIAVCKLTHPHH